MFLRVPKTIIREGGTSQYLLYAEKRKNTEKQMSEEVNLSLFCRAKRYFLYKYQRDGIVAKFIITNSSSYS